MIAILSNPVVVLALAATLVGGLALGWLARTRFGHRDLVTRAGDWEDRFRVEALAAEVARREASRLGDDIKALRSRLGSAEASLEGAQAALQTRIAEVERLRAVADEATGELSLRDAALEVLVREASEVGPLREHLVAAEVACQRAQAQRVALTARCEAVEAERNRVRSEQARLSVQVESLQAELGRTVEAGARELEAQRAALRAANAVVEQARREAAAATGLAERLAGEIEPLTAERDAAAAEASGMAATIQTHAARVREAELRWQARLAEKDAAIGALEAGVERLGPLGRQLEDREALFQAAAFERDDARRRLVAEQRDHERELRIHKGRIVAAERREAEVTARQVATTEVERRLAAASRERDEAVALARRRATEVETMRAERRERDRRFRLIAHENEQLIAGLEHRQQSLEAQLAGRPTPSGHGGNGWHAPPTPPPDADNLTRIRGIGPILARRLNVRGVYRFSDIAAWTDHDIEWFSRELGPMGHRIRRDDWIGAARRAQNDHHAAPV